MVLKAKKSGEDDERKNKMLKAFTEEDTIRLNADIPASLHRELRIMCARKGVKMKQFVIEALTESVKRYAKDYE